MSSKLSVVPGNGTPQGSKGGSLVVCIMCEAKIVGKIWGRIGDNHQTCSKECDTKYQALSFDEKATRRKLVKSVRFQPAEEVHAPKNKGGKEVPADFKDGGRFSGK